MEPNKFMMIYERKIHIKQEEREEQPSDGERFPEQLATMYTAAQAKTEPIRKLQP